MQWQSLRTRARRPLKFVSVGAFMTAINAVVLVLLVDGLGLFASLANLVRIICTTQLHFYLHRIFTWRGEHGTTLWQQWWRFHAMKAGSSALNWSGCYVLTVWVGVHYLLAYLGCVTVLGIVNIFLSGKFVFRSRDATLDTEVLP